MYNGVEIWYCPFVEGIKGRILELLTKCPNWQIKGLIGHSDVFVICINFDGTKSPKKAAGKGKLRLNR